jgi:hypothetical protein
LNLAAPGAVHRLPDATARQLVGLVVAWGGFGAVGPFLERDIADELNVIDGTAPLR